MIKGSAEFPLSYNYKCQLSIWYDVVSLNKLIEIIIVGMLLHLAHKSSYPHLYSRYKCMTISNALHYIPLIKNLYHGYYCICKFVALINLSFILEMLFFIRMACKGLLQYTIIMYLSHKHLRKNYKSVLLCQLLFRAPPYNFGLTLQITCQTPITSSVLFHQKIWGWYQLHTFENVK
jgi:hypothetical protein